MFSYLFFLEQDFPKFKHKYLFRASFNAYSELFCKKYDKNKIA